MHIVYANAMTTGSIVGSFNVESATADGRIQVIKVQNRDISLAARTMTCYTN